MKKELELFHVAGSGMSAGDAPWIKIGFKGCAGVMIGTGDTFAAGMTEYG